MLLPTSVVRRRHETKPAVTAGLLIGLAGGWLGDLVLMPRKNDLTERCVASLPFRLTGAQTRVWAEIAKDLKRPHPMMRLVQEERR